MNNGVTLKFKTEIEIFKGLYPAKYNRGQKGIHLPFRNYFKHILNIIACLLLNTSIISLILYMYTYKIISK